MKKVFLFITLCGLVTLSSFMSNSNPSEPSMESVEYPVGLEYTYYETLEEFEPIVEAAITEILSNALSTDQPYGVSVVKDGFGYGISAAVSLDGTGIVPGDVHLCSECTPGMGGSQVDATLDDQPCYWMIAFSSYVWGYSGEDAC